MVLAGVCFIVAAVGVLVAFLTGTDSALRTTVTVLAAGVLNVGHDSALGTGALTVDTASLGDVHAGLFATGGARTTSVPVGA